MRMILFSVMLIAYSIVPSYAADDFEAYYLEEQNSFVQYTEEDVNGYFAYHDAIVVAWGGFKGTTPETWVDYSKDLQTRSSVNFEKGYVEVETVVPTTQKAPVKRALPLLQKQLKKVASGCKKRAGFSLDATTAKITHVEHAASVVSSKVQGKKIVQVRIPLPSDYLVKSAQKYKKLVTRFASQFDVNKDFVFAVIHTESYFNPFARSHVPAFGLMQLVPVSGGRDAYNYVYKKNVTPTEKYLYVPENNIRLGVAYLSKIKTCYFKGIKEEIVAYMLAVAAYNTGPGNVARALTGSKRLDKAVRKANSMTAKEVYAALQRHLPYDETKTYVKKVVERSRLYRNL